MSEKKTAYEVCEAWREKSVVMFQRDAIIRAKTVKFVVKSRSPDTYGDGKTAGGYRSTAPIELCDFTPADAWARFIAKVEGEIADLEEQITARRSVLADAVAKAGSELAP